MATLCENRSCWDETNGDDELVKASYARGGANVMGRRMFDEGEVGWPESRPFGRRCLCLHPAGLSI
jgi:dihydrofolate reductase